MLGIEHARLYEFLYNKSVVLVGGLDSADKNVLTSADVVIRVNQHAIRQGGRSDGLYVATSDPCELDKLKNVPTFFAYRVSGVYARQYHDWGLRNRCLMIPYQNEQYGKTCPLGCEYEWTNIVNWEMGAKPFTGMLAVAHLCSFPIKTLYITGMDGHINSCKELETLNDGVILKRDAHEIVPQLRWLKNKMQCDQRIVVDALMQEVIYEWGK